MAAKDNRQKINDSCPKQEVDIEEGCAPCEATTCEAGDDTGCADCE